MKKIDVFPIIDSDFYDNNSLKVSDHPVIKTLSKKNVSLNQKQLTAGWFLKPVDTFYRALYFHKLGFRAALELKTTQANFYWEQCYRMFSKIYDNELLWEDLEKEFKIAVNLKNTIVKQLFVFTHIGFINSFVEKADTDVFKKLAAQQLEFCNKAVRLFLVSDSNEGTYIKQLSWFIMDKYDELHFYEELRNEAEFICLNYPDDRRFLIRFVESVFSTAMAALTSGDYKANQNILQKAISKIEKHAFEGGKIEIYWYRLGELYYYYGIALANDDIISKALLALRKAHAYNPYIKGIDKTWETVAERMTTMQEQIKPLLLQLRKEPTSQLNEAGKKMKAETETGFKLADEFAKNEAEGIVKKRRNAYLYEFFDEELRNENNQLIAEPLDEVVSELLNEGKTRLLQIQASLTKLLEKYPALKHISEKKIAEYILKCKNKTLEDRDKESEQLLQMSGLNSLKISAKREIIDSREEPFVFWLGSPKDIFIKSIVAAASFLLLFSAALFSQKIYSENKRNYAFSELNAAISQNADSKVIVGKSADFLDHLPLLGNDARTAGVINIYQKEMARWFMEDEQLDKEQFTSYLKRYSNITN